MLFRAFGVLETISNTFTNCALSRKMRFPLKFKRDWPKMLVVTDRATFLVGLNTYSLGTPDSSSQKGSTSGVLFLGARIFQSHFIMTAA